VPSKSSVGADLCILCLISYSQTRDFKVFGEIPRVFNFIFKKINYFLFLLCDFSGFFFVKPNAINPV